MSKTAKTWLVVAVSLIIVGIAAFSCGMTMLKWDFAKLSTVKYETNSYSVSEKYNSISINTDTADILFVPSENSETTVVCEEHERAKHSVTVKDGTLFVEVNVEVNDNRKWYDNIGLFLRSPKITVYLPEGEYGGLLIKNHTGDVEISDKFGFESIDISESTGDIRCYASVKGNVKLKTNTGKINIEKISANSMELYSDTGSIVLSEISCENVLKIEVETGKVTLTDVKCNSLSSDGDTGDMILNKVLVTERLFAERSTGDVELDRCDASEIFIKTDTGDIEGSLLSEKIFYANTDTGRVRVPKTTAGGICELTTDTGDIDITVHSEQIS